jgi:hypothetical protein
VQSGGGAADVALVGDGDEGTQVTQLGGHVCSA